MYNTNTAKISILETHLTYTTNFFQPQEPPTTLPFLPLLKALQQELTLETSELRRRASEGQQRARKLQERQAELVQRQAVTLRREDGGMMMLVGG